MSEYIVPQATALFGAAFLQYFAYGFLYMVEGCKLSEIKDEENQRNASSDANEMRPVSGDSAYSSNPSGPAGNGLQLEGGDDDEAPNGIKVEEVELDVPEEEKKAFSAWCHWTKDDQLLESGLIGPVKIYSLKTE